MTSNDNLRMVRHQLAEARKKHMAAAVARTETSMGEDKRRQVQAIVPGFDKAMELPVKGADKDRDR
ncbi:hypothetical protein IAI18_01505 [Acetobacteraceae bacterium H6797]|nr:hypothetical protein [Acetobacteraceae bacterium H6797]